NPQPMWIVDLRTGGFMLVNKAAQRHLGFASDEMVDRNAADFLQPDWAGLFQTELARPCPIAQGRGVWPHVRKDGVVIEMEIGAIDLSCSETPARLIVAQDVTERQHHQADFLHAQKMEAVGKVSGGVGQQFSGILATIESNASHLLPRMTDIESVEQVKHISAAAVRGSGLTRQLLAIGSQQQIQPEVLDLNGLVRDMNHMLGKLVGDRITIYYNYGAFTAPILADPRLMEHILVNLVLNARDAIATSGQITISTTTVRFDKQSDDDRSPVGEFVKLSVRDSGCGMTPEVQAHVFEPFFTTRGASKAIGLGLASIYGIARQHSGWIEFSSEAGCGSEFRVLLPCAPAYELTAKQMRAASPVSKRTILLVEPDDRVRSMARCALDWQGYRVIEADSAQLALQLWERQSVKIDLLLAEAGAIGGLSGIDLAARLLQSKPSLKVVCTSDSKSRHVPTSMPPGVLKLLAKPFTREKLLADIRMTFDGEC
ncbi:MAG TPA: ATP-binding protein, partial [Candidatus Paceibacterota bacterium]|nr:ATP-binding protein [Candidatus Paceibacterota bacterium]